jgi:hypothetical protein
MKSLITLFCLTLLTSPALAQSRPFRLMLGGSNLTGGANAFSESYSLDIKAPRRKKEMLSLYHDSYTGAGFGCVAVVLPGPRPPAQRLDSFSGWGISLRQPLTKNTYSGLGLGGYLTRFRDCNAQSRNQQRIGGKLFVGVGSGLFLSELAVTSPGALRNTQLSLSLGVRL